MHLVLVWLWECAWEIGCILVWISENCQCGIELQREKPWGGRYTQATGLWQEFCRSCSRTKKITNILVTNEIWNVLWRINFLSEKSNMKTVSEPFYLFLRGIQWILVRRHIFPQTLLTNCIYISPLLKCQPSEPCSRQWKLCFLDSEMPKKFMLAQVEKINWATSYILGLSREYQRRLQRNAT